MGKDAKLRPEGRRTRERPRETYMDSIEEITRKNGTRVTVLRKIMENRIYWRRWIGAVRRLEP